MFSDQDDVWEPRKIEILLAATQEMEAQHGPAVPILTHSDSQVVDENLHLIAPSLLKYLNRAPNPDVNRLCMELPILGHSVMMNRACKVLGGASVPDGFGSWDWWFPLVAVVFGYIHFVKEPLVRYRRHPSTAILLRGHGLSAYLTRSLRDHHRRVNISLRQCEIFHKIFEDRLDPEHKAFFASVSRIRSASWLMRRVLVVRHRLFKTGFLKTAGVVLAV
jgi:hypothetical protein